MANAPQNYYFTLDPENRPDSIAIPELLYPGIRDFWDTCTSSRSVHPIKGVKAIVIHTTTADTSSVVSYMKENKISFHWIVPNEDEEHHSRIVWLCVPEALAAWHIRDEDNYQEFNDVASGINDWSLSILVLTSQYNSDKFSDWQIEITAKIVRYCWSLFPNLEVVVCHDTIVSEADFPWEKLKELVLDSQYKDRLSLAIKEGWAGGQSIAEFANSFHENDGIIGLIDSIQGIKAIAPLPPPEGVAALSTLSIKYTLDCEMTIKQVEQIHVFTLGFTPFVKRVHKQGDAARKTFKNTNNDPFVVPIISSTGEVETDLLDISIKILGSALPSGGQCFKLTLEWFDSEKNNWIPFPPNNPADPTHTIKACLNVNGLASFSGDVRWK